MSTPPPNQPPAWGQPPQQPAPGWGQQPTPPKKSSAGKKVGLGCLGVIGAFILIGAIGAALDKKSGSTATVATATSPAAKAPAPATPASHTPTPTPAPATSAAPAAPAPAPATSAAPAAPETLLALSGSGIKNTAQFTTGDSWTLTYTYDCSNFGDTGNFIVTDETGMPLVNELQAKGSGSSPQYSSGIHHLSINSECKWTVKVTSGS